MNLESSIDPDIKKLLTLLNSQPASSPSSDIAAGRHDYLMFALINGGCPLSLARVEDILIPTQDYHQIPLRIYTPVIDQRLPALVYYHGGGWQRGSIATHDSICRHLSKLSGCIVVSVDWRLAPEYRFPIGINDCLTSYQWTMHHGHQYNIDHTRLAIGGDSAGGNMAAAILQHLQHLDIQQPIFQLLLYPSLDLTCSSWSFDRYGQGYFLTAERVKYYIDHYINPGDDLKDPLLSPLFQTNFSYLPPTHIVTAGFDPLRGEAEAYFDKLKQGQVNVSYHCYTEMIHAFLHMSHTVPAVRIVLQQISAVLRQALLK